MHAYEETREFEKQKHENFSLKSSPHSLFHSTLNSTTCSYTNEGFHIRESIRFKRKTHKRPRIRTGFMIMDSRCATCAHATPTIAEEWLCHSFGSGGKRAVFVASHLIAAQAYTEKERLHLLEVVLAREVSIQWLTQGRYSSTLLASQVASATPQQGEM